MENTKAPRMMQISGRCAGKTSAVIEHLTKEVNALRAQLAERDAQLAAERAMANLLTKRLRSFIMVFSGDAKKVEVSDGSRNFGEARFDCTKRKQ